MIESVTASMLWEVGMSAPVISVCNPDNEILSCSFCLLNIPLNVFCYICSTKAKNTACSCHKFRAVLCPVHTSSINSRTLINPAISYLGLQNYSFVVKVRREGGILWFNKRHLSKPESISSAHKKLGADCISDRMSRFFLLIVFWRDITWGNVHVLQRCTTFFLFCPDILMRNKDCGVKLDFTLCSGLFQM